MARLLDANSIRVSLSAGQAPPPDSDTLVVRWTSPPDLPADSLFQVYLNSELAVATSDPLDRELALAYGGSVPAGRTLSVCVLAVSPAEVGVSWPHLLDPQQRGQRALLRWPRLNLAEPGSTLNVFGNGGVGPIDFQRPLNSRPIDWFTGGSNPLDGEPAPAEPDGEPATGFGQGAFGLSVFGFDAEWAEWLSDPLPPGVHHFAMVGYDSLGNPADAPPAEFDLTIHTPPAAVTQVSAAGNSTDNSITLTWTT